MKNIQWNVEEWEPILVKNPIHMEYGMVCRRKHHTEDENHNDSDDKQIQFKSVVYEWMPGSPLWRTRTSHVNAIDEAICTVHFRATEFDEFVAWHGLDWLGLVCLLNAHKCWRKRIIYNNAQSHSRTHTRIHTVKCNLNKSKNRCPTETRHTETKTEFAYWQSTLWRSVNGARNPADRHLLGKF